MTGVWRELVAAVSHVRSGHAAARMVLGHWGLSRCRLLVLTLCSGSVVCWLLF